MRLRDHAHDPRIPDQAALGKNLTPTAHNSRFEASTGWPLGWVHEESSVSGKRPVSALRPTAGNRGLLASGRHCLNIASYLALSLWLESLAESARCSRAAIRAVLSMSGAGRPANWRTSLRALVTPSAATEDCNAFTFSANPFSLRKERCI